MKKLTAPSTSPLKTQTVHMQTTSVPTTSLYLANNALHVPGWIMLMSASVTGAGGLELHILPAKRFVVYVVLMIMKRNLTVSPVEAVCWRASLMLLGAPTFPVPGANTPMPLTTHHAEPGLSISTRSAPKTNFGLMPRSTQQHTTRISSGMPLEAPSAETHTVPPTPHHLYHE